MPDNVDVLRRHTKHEGTLDGYLQQVNGHGELGFSIFDVMTGKGIPCSFGDALRGEVKRSLYERVRVSGMVHYTRAGQPTRIEATNIVQLPKCKAGLFRIPPIDITGGEDAVDYIERLRGDE